MNGKINAKKISVNESLTFRPNKGESVIESITGGKIDIGHKGKVNLIQNLSNQINKSDIITIGTIISNDTVKLIIEVLKK